MQFDGDLMTGKCCDCTIRMYVSVLQLREGSEDRLRLEHYTDPLRNPTNDLCGGYS